MRILVFGNNDGLGGAQTAFREFVSFLLSEGHSVGAVAITGAKRGLLGESRLTMLRRVPSAHKSFISNFRKLEAIASAAIASRAFSPDVFVSVGLSRSANLIARILKRGCFSICQDFIAGRSPSDPILINATRSFGAMATQAPSMAESLATKGFSAVPLTWLPCFPTPPENGLQRRPDQSGIRIAYFGRLVRNKGLDVFLEALADAKFHVPITLDIWGTGPEAERLNSVLRNQGAPKSVALRGAYPLGRTGAELMCGYHALVLPSRDTEGLPLILLEAMAYGLPVLVTNVGAARDCCIGNPDFVLVESDCRSLSRGVELLVIGLAGGRFDTKRLQTFYQKRFSRTVLANRWRTFLADPAAFVQ